MVVLHFSDSRIRYFAICTLPTWRWWSARTSCSSCAASNHKV